MLLILSHYHLLCKPSTGSSRVVLGDTGGRLSGVRGASLGPPSLGLVRLVEEALGPNFEGHPSQQGFLLSKTKVPFALKPGAKQSHPRKQFWPLGQVTRSHLAFFTDRQRAGGCTGGAPSPSMLPGPSGRQSGRVFKAVFVFSIHFLLVQLPLFITSLSSLQRRSDNKPGHLLQR